MSRRYPHLVDIKRKVDSETSSGFPTGGYVTIYTDVKCNVQAMKGNENMQGGRKFSMPAYKIYFEAAIGVILEDIAVFSNENFEIVEPDSYPGKYDKFVMEKSELEL